LTPHVLSAVRFTDVDEDRPTINIVDPDTGNVRPALHSTSSCGSYGFRQISAICLAMLPSNSSAQS